VLTRFPLPTLDAAFLASLMRGLLAVLVLAAGVWIVNGWIVRQLYKSTGDTSPDIEKRTRSA
jgi:cobalamin synthase